VSIAEAVFW